jgi:hypothetical protein
MMDPKAQKQEIKRLTRALSQKDRALRREKRENAALKRELSALKNGYGRGDATPNGTVKKSKQAVDTAHKAQLELIRTGVINARRFSKKSYISYLYQSVKESGIGLFFRRVVRIWRRLRLVRIITAVTAAVVATLLLSAVFLTLIPFFMLFALVAFLAVCLRAKATNKKMAEVLSGKRVRVMIFSDAVAFRGDTFAEGCAKAMARESDTAVLVITPYFFSPRGLGGRGMFFTARREANDLYLVRKCYYFLLRRRVLDAVCGEVTFVY